MTATTSAMKTDEGRFPRTTRQIGYGATILVNVGLLYIVNNVLEWGWFGFLTEDFTDVLPILNLSIALNLSMNVVFMFFDHKAFVAIANAGLSVVSLAVIVRIYQVFPFEFETGPWTGVFRVVLVLVGFALIAGIIGSIVEFARALPRDPY